MSKRLFVLAFVCAPLFAQSVILNNSGKKPTVLRGAVYMRSMRWVGYGGSALRMRSAISLSGSALVTS